jgi:hypothetical protein
MKIFRVSASLGTALATDGASNRRAPLLGEHTPYIESLSFNHHEPVGEQYLKGRREFKTKVKINTLLAVHEGVNCNQTYSTAFVQSNGHGKCYLLQLAFKYMFYTCNEFCPRGLPPFHGVVCGLQMAQ